MSYKSSKPADALHSIQWKHLQAVSTDIQLSSRTLRGRRQAHERYVHSRVVKVLGRKRAPRNAQWKQMIFPQP